MNQILRDVRRLCGFGLAVLLLAAWPAVRAEEVRIAFIDPFSGPLGVLGKTGINAFRASEEIVQESGKAGPDKLVFVEFDNKFSPSETLLQFKAAVDQGYRYVIQGVGSGASAALIDAIEKYNQRNPGKEVVFINWTSNDPELTNARCSFWHFRLDAHSDMKMEGLTSFMSKDKAIRKVYLINPNGAAGQQVSVDAKEYFKRKRPDLEIVGDDLHAIAQVKDFSPYVSKIKASGADSVITGSNAVDLALLIKAAREANLNVEFYTLFANGGGIPTAMGAASAGRVKLLSYYTPNVENFSGKAVVERMKSRYNDDFTPMSGYSGVVMLHEAFKKTGSTDPVKVAWAMEGMKFQSLSGEVEMRKLDHQAEQPLYIATWAKVDGKTVKYDQENTGYGWKTDEKLDAFVSAQPTNCQMKRPAQTP